MSTPADLMGLGMPSGLANRIGNLPIAVTAAGTSAGAATLMTGSRMFNVNSQSSATGAIIDSNTSIGAVLYISCVHASGATAVIYPPSGATITNASSVNLAQDKNMIVWRVSSTVFYHVILA